jgi:phage tail P2-like protein
MAKALTDITFKDLLPESIKNDPTISAAAQALDGEIQAVNSDLEKPLLYARLDELPEPIVDHLAWQLHVDFWEPDLPIERKRDLVRQSIAWHKYKGTVWAVRQALIWSGFGDAEIKEHNQLIQEWNDAGGGFLDGVGILDGEGDLSAPDGDFRFMTSNWAEFSVRANAAEIELVPGEQSRIRRMVHVAKPARSHLVGLEFFALYRLLSRITLGNWSANVRSVYDRCGSAKVPGFDIIGWGCEEIGGGYQVTTLDGSGTLDGWAEIDGLEPAGELLDDGHWGTMQARIQTPRYQQTLGNDRIFPGGLDPDHRAVPDDINGIGDLSVATLDGSEVLDGGTDLSVEPLVRYTYDMLDGTETLGELPGPGTVWHTGCITWWNGNNHYREAI